MMDEQDRRWQEARNRCCLYVFVAFVSGFLIAMYLGAFATAENDEVNDWVVAIIAGISASISALAVYYVFHTLKATRETLEASKDMLENQKAIGKLQTQAWILPLSLECELDGEAVFRFKNFGTTPCLNLCYGTRSFEFDKEYRYEAITDNFKLDNRAGIVAPSNTFRISFGKLYQAKIIQVKWQYETIHGDKVEDSIQYQLHRPQPGRKAYGVRIRDDMIGRYADDLMAIIDSIIMSEDDGADEV